RDRIVGVDESAHAVLAPGDTDDDAILQSQRRGGNAVAQHRVRYRSLPQRLAGARIESDQRRVERSEEYAIPQHRYAAIESIVLIRLDGLGRTLIAPDAETGARIQSVDVIRLARDVHDAVDYQGCGFENGIAGHLHGPSGLEI